MLSGAWKRQRGGAVSVRHVFWLPRGSLVLKEAVQLRSRGGCGGGEDHNSKIASNQYGSGGDGGSTPFDSNCDWLIRSRLNYLIRCVSACNIELRLADLAGLQLDSKQPG